MKRIIVFSSLVFVGAISAHRAEAYLGNSALTAVNVGVYAMYTTSDASCQTDWVTTIPFSASPVAVNMVDNAALGAGPLSNPVRCVLLVLSNTFGPHTWKAGTYTGTSTNNFGTPYTGSDNISACNSGGTVAASAGCNNGTTFTWPTQVQTDAAAAGVTLPSSCPASLGSQPVPHYLSVNSACSFVSPLDSEVTGCASAPMTGNFSTPPTSVGDTSRGQKLESPDSGGSVYRMYIDWSYAFGATSASTCGMTNAGRLGMKKVQ